jgi:Protein of unknown function (DUF3182)
MQIEHLPYRSGSRNRGAPHVVVYSPLRVAEHGHEAVTCCALAKKVADLLGYEFGGEYNLNAVKPDRPMFLVPTTTITTAQARALGVLTNRNLFGGVVPYAFVATKAIVHGLRANDSPAPEHWCHRFSESVRELVPNGFMAFSLQDALRAGTQMLERGALRIKPAWASGGRGQLVVSSSKELNAALSLFEEDEVATHGLALEENFLDPITYSIGTVSLGDVNASYYGTQRATNDNFGAVVYGGSDLIVCRSDFEALLNRPMPAEARVAAQLARRFDAAVALHFPEFFASRRNYDVIAGIDQTGRRRCAVIEQSWRIGGASGAELAALELFKDDPGLHCVHASTVELYGRDHELPGGATVYFDGVDDKVGRITKYAIVKSHGYL